MLYMTNVLSTIPSIVQGLEHRADVLVVVDHGVRVLAHPAPGLTQAFRLHMRAKMHVREVHPDKERLARLRLALDEISSPLRHVVVDRLHPLPGKWSRVLDRLLADLAESRIHSRIVRVCRFAVEHAPRTVLFTKGRVLGIVAVLWFFLGVEMIQIAIELIEAVDGRQEFVAVTQMVLAELAGRISASLEHRGDCRIFLLQPECGPRQTDFGQPRSHTVLAGNERRPTRRTALFSVVIRKQHPLAGNAIDIRGPIAHHASRVRAEVRLPDIVTPNNHNVGLLLLCRHDWCQAASQARCQHRQRRKMPIACAHHVLLDGNEWIGNVPCGCPNSTGMVASLGIVARYGHLARGTLCHSLTQITLADLSFGCFVVPSESQGRFHTMKVTKEEGWDGRTSRSRRVGR